MNEHHLTALRHHCRFAFETVHPRFAWIVGGRYTAVLTVNSGYE